MPAIFPPVEIDGERYIDGGVVEQRPDPTGHRCRRHPDRRPPLLTADRDPATAPGDRSRAWSTPCFIAIHARFVRDMAHLPEGVEVILCSGPEGATRDFDDFSTTEHLIALGRAEASEVVRRYALGTIAYPAPPMPGAHHRPTSAGGAAGADDATGRPGRRNRTGRRRSASADPSAGRVPGGGHGGVPRVTPVGPRGATGDPARSRHVAPHDLGRHPGEHAVVGEDAAHDRTGAPPPRSCPVPSRAG